MKSLKKLFPLFLFIAPFMVSASILPGSSALNPIYVQVETTTSYEAKIENLKTIYGTDNYYSCYANNLNSYGCRQAALASTTYNKDSYLLQCYTYMQSCLEQKITDTNKNANCGVGTVYYNNQCVTPDEGCRMINGVGAYSSGFNQNTGKYDCACSSGYSIGSSGCVVNLATTLNNDEANCLKYSNAQYVPFASGLQGGVCGCLDGYQWNIYGGGCKEIESLVDNNAIKLEKKSPTVVDVNLSNKMKGKILLQVENHGEAWYVNPKDGVRYYMADGDKAYTIMRDLGVGITNKDLDKIKSNETFAKKNAGKIFLQVESRGEAYYIDFNGNANYLKNGADAYEIMRNLGLGITNDNIDKIIEQDLK